MAAYGEVGLAAMGTAVGVVNSAPEVLLVAQYVQ